MEQGVIRFTEEQNRFLEKKKCGVRFSDRAIAGTQNYEVVAEIVTLDQPQQTVCVATHPADRLAAANTAIQMLRSAKMPDRIGDEEMDRLHAENEELRRKLAAKEGKIADKEPISTATYAAPGVDLSRSEEEAEAALNATASEPHVEPFKARRRRGRPPNNPVESVG